MQYIDYQSCHYVYYCYYLQIICARTRDEHLEPEEYNLKLHLVPVLVLVWFNLGGLSLSLFLTQGARFGLEIS